MTAFPEYPHWTDQIHDYVDTGDFDDDFDDEDDVRRATAGLVRYPEELGVFGGWTTEYVRSGKSGKIPTFPG